MVLALVLLVLVLGGGAGWFLLGPNSSLSRQHAASEYEAALQLTNEANDSVAELTHLVSGDLDDKAAQRIEAILEKLPEAEEKLAEARLRVDAQREILDADPQGADASALCDSIDVRKDLLSSGELILRASLGAYRASSQVDLAWENMMAGYSSLQDASASITVGTTEEVQAVLSLDKEALEQFSQAQSALKKVAKQAPSADLNSVKKYLKLQKKVAKAAVESDEALLANDSASAEEASEKYRKLSVEAANAANSLPSTKDDLVKSIYYSFGTDSMSVQDAINIYDEAAKRVASVDAKLAQSETSKGM